MISDLDLSVPDPAGPSAGGLTVVGRVYGVDVTARLVQVSVLGSEALWLPAQPGRYRAGSGTDGSLARVLLHPTTGRPELVVGPLDPMAPSRLATVTAMAGTTVEVSWDGVATPLPAIPSTYTVGQTAWVLTTEWGVPVLVLGPSTTSAPAPPTPPPAPGGGGTVQVSQTIGPQWSGSYRHIRAAWDRWNTDRYGGRSTLYQGNGQGSGPMTGLAVYGDQLVNLGAISIDRVRVRLRNVGLASGSPPVVIQGSPHGTPPAGAPVYSGDTAGGMDGWLDLSASVREGMRTGAVKGLATVGAAYSAVAGAGNGDGMVLIVDYTRAA